ncbi:hypothetical protein BCS42_12440 [Crenothrix sp. D3]|nr:hypothetical protein BCS42_12440 [Crenothrix sp. D3]
MKSKDLVNLMFSPQWVAKLLHYFLSGAQSISKEGIKTELLYLSLPFIIDDTTRGKLVSAVKTSTFSTTFQNNSSLEIKNSLIQKNEQIKQFHEITNSGIIYLGNIENLKIGSFIVASKTIDYKKEKGISRDYCKAAYYLGVIFAREDYRSVFVKLGITNI